MYAWLFTLLLLLTTTWAASDHPIETAIASAMRADAPAALVLVLEDVHPLYGGARFDLTADGTLTRTDVPRAQQGDVVSHTRLDSPDRTALLALLMGLEVWEQRVEDRTPVPGESRAYLGVRLDGAEASFWEWANDLPSNERMVRVQKWLDARLPAGAP